MFWLDEHEEAMVLVSANGLHYGKQYGQRAIFVIDVECDVSKDTDSNV